MKSILATILSISIGASCVTDSQFRREMCIKRGSSDLGLEILRSDKKYPDLPEGASPPKVKPESMIEPRYPKKLGQAQLGGYVFLLIDIDKKGNVSHIEYLCGDGYLARSTIFAMMKWKFTPAMLNGEPIESKLLWEFLYKPKDGPVDPESI